MDIPFFNCRPKKREQILAVDLGSRTTKAILLQRQGERFSLVNYTLQDAPISDRTPSPELLGEHLANVTRPLGAKTKRLEVAVSVEDALLRPAEVPAVPLPEMRMMVKYSAKTYLQQELPDHTFDCFILPARPGSEGSRPGQKCKVLIGGAKNQFVNDLRAAARTAGLVLDFIAPNLIGPINALEMAQPEIFRTGAIAIVDLGFRNTTISILLNGELILQRVVNIGGDKLTTGLAEAMNIGYAEAEGIKIGLSEEVQPNLQALVSPIGRELRASLDYFEHQYDKPVSKVLLSGGSSRSEFILQTLQEELMVPCMTWDPTNFLQPSLPPERMGDFDQVSSQLTVAVGTAVAVF